MKLKSKIVVAFCIMVILPTVTFAVLSTGIFQYKSSSIQQLYDVDWNLNLNSFDSSAALMGRIMERIYQDMKEIADNMPEKYNDIKFLEQTNKELEKKLTQIVVKREDTIIYKSDNISVDVLNELIDIYDVDVNEALSDVSVYKGDEYQCFIRCIQFSNNDNEEISVYLITSLKQSIPQIKGFATEIIILGLIVIAITSVVLMIWIYNSIFRPIEKLRLATNNIKQGNYDFEMPKASKDEIGDVFRDFEEMRIILKNTSEQKIISDKEEKELIRNISHDLKTPITAVKGYVEGILDGVADTPEKQKKYLMTIANKANDMDKLIDELTIYSRLGSNRVQYLFRKICVADYFNEYCDEISMDLESQDILLEYNCHQCDNVYIIADAEQLKRVVNNIISNSVKYMCPDRKGIINIDIFDEEVYVHIIMKDNGKGIGINDLSHIFERFYRTDSSRNSKQGGSGIGLAIVKKIIEDHRGKIWAESVEGKGTTMHICLKKDIDNSTYLTI